MSGITVIVLGGPKAGKTAVATIIERALRERGLDVQHVDQDGGCPLTPVTLAPRIDALASKQTPISIREVSA